MVMMTVVGVTVMGSEDDGGGEDDDGDYGGADGDEV